MESQKLRFEQLIREAYERCCLNQILGILSRLADQIITLNESIKEIETVLSKHHERIRKS